MAGMDTEKLIIALARDGNAVRAAGIAGLRLHLLLATLAGGASVAVLVLLLLGWHGTYPEALTAPPLMLKLALGIGLATSGLQICLRLTQPGCPAFTFGTLLPVGIMLAAMVLVFLQWSAARSVPADQAAVAIGCMLSIALFATIPMFALILVLRRGAPTHLRLSGMLAGLTSGAIVVIGFAFHCPLENAAVILGTYLIALAGTSGVGALLGPRLFAW